MEGIMQPNLMAKKINSQPSYFLKIYRALGLVLSGLALGVMVLLSLLIPSQSILQLTTRVFFLFLIPPLIVFRGFFIAFVNKKPTFGQLIEAAFVALVTAFIINTIRLNAFSPGEVSAFFISSYVLPIIIAVIGFVFLYNVANKGIASSQAYLLILAGTIIAVNISLFMLIKTGLGTGKPLSLAWSLIFLIVFPIPSLVILIKELISAKIKNPETTFLIWAGLGNMFLATMLATINGGFSIASIYFILLILLTITALLVEFST